jgi:hypothetical protein
LNNGMSAVVDWLRSIGRTVLLEGDGRYALYELSPVGVVDALNLLAIANRARRKRGLEPFADDLAASRHTVNRKRQRGSMNLVVGVD